MILGIGAYLLGRSESNTSKSIAQKITPTVAPTPTPEGPYQYQIPKIQKKREYQIMLLGDSMTYALGPHGGKFYEDINALYKDSGHGILIDNYAQPSTSVLTIKNAMNRKQQYWDASFEPMLSRNFDMVLIESFGYNPLSQFGKEKGLKKQTEILDDTVRTLMREKPNAAIVFVATIAPSKTSFARNVEQGMSQTGRADEVEEREAYIQNHIDYAKMHNTPVINIFEKSTLPNGDGNVEYINPDDDIHPSAVGLIFIGQQMADFIYNSNIFPK